MYGKNKVGIELQMSVGSIENKSKKYCNEEFSLSSCSFNRDYLGMSFLKRFERTYSAPTDDVVVKLIKIIFCFR